MAEHKIKNLNYRKFMDEGIISLIGIEQLGKALENVKGIYGAHIEEGRCLLITLYYTGARPCEVLDLRPEDFKKFGKELNILFAAKKKGLAGTLTFPMSKPYIEELYNYTLKFYRGIYIFYHYRSNYVRRKISKKGKEIVRMDVSDALRYHMYQWFKGIIDNAIPPYYLRHNRISQLAMTGATDRDLRQWKRCKSNDSILPYIHMSQDRAKKLGKMVE